MPDIIKLLPDSVANQIAAGEVIQRPASVVKELVENSVDAGAGSIKVIIRDAGKTLIQVIDDGSGMSETDARLAFERHATSKINSANDLFAISTKGFRGEALASIAAVSMVELRTRRKEDEAGTLVMINGSRVELQEPCSCPAGSSFSVKSLFFNIPARRKFLKSDNTEIRHIISEFQKVALAHPEIRFCLYHNDTELYNLQESNQRQRIIGIFGKNIGNDLIGIDTDTTLLKIKGYTGKPENARRTFGEQFFFVNKRYIRHSYFHKAVMEAYQNILPAESVPSYFIFLEADPARIDINIHPTKTEVKFEDERALWQILMASVREALGRFNIAPSLDFENEALIDIPVANRSAKLPEPPSIEIDPLFNPFSGDERPARDKFAGFFERERAGKWESVFPENISSKEMTDKPVSDGIKRNLFQVKLKYILSPVKSGLMLIDQKRAHERILFERFLSTLSGDTKESQSSLFPEKMELNPEEYELLNEIQEEIKLLGFDISDLGNRVISINSIPAATSGNNPAELLNLLLAEFRSRQADPADGVKEKVAASLARSAAIRYGKTLTQTEMEDLFDNLFACGSPNYSPTGKPVIQIITMEELERRFK